MYCSEYVNTSIDLHLKHESWLSRYFNRWQVPTMMLLKVTGRVNDDGGFLRRAHCYAENDTPNVLQSVLKLTKSHFSLDIPRFMFQWFNVNPGYVNTRRHQDSPRQRVQQICFILPFDFCRFRNADVSRRHY